MYFKTELLIDSSILNGCVKKWPKYQNGQNALVLTAIPVSSAGKCGGEGKVLQNPNKLNKFLISYIFVF